MERPAPTLFLAQLSNLLAGNLSISTSDEVAHHSKTKNKMTDAPPAGHRST
jgi:hypothetical protein